MNFYVSIKFSPVKKLTLFFFVIWFSTISKTPSMRQTQRSLWKRGTKIIKGRRSAFHEMASPRNVRSCPHKASQTWPNMNLRRMIGLTMLTWTGHCLRWLTLHEDMYAQGLLRAWKIIFHRKTTPIYFLYQIVSPEINTYIDKYIIQIEKVVFMILELYIFTYVCNFVYVYVCVTTINKKIDHKFWRKQRETYGSFWQV